MSQSGATVAQECITEYNNLKLSKAHKWIIFALKDGQIVIDDNGTSSDANYETFVERLKTATSADKRGKVGPGPRYAVYDFEYELASGEGVRNKIAFIAWSPDDASPSVKMPYASSKEALKRALTGYSVEIQANDSDELEWKEVLNKVSKGTGRA